MQFHWRDMEKRTSTLETIGSNEQQVVSLTHLNTLHLLQHFILIVGRRIATAFVRLFAASCFAKNLTWCVSVSRFTPTFTLSIGIVNRGMQSWGFISDLLEVKRRSSSHDSQSWELHGRKKSVNPSSKVYRPDSCEILGRGSWHPKFHVTRSGTVMMVYRWKTRRTATSYSNANQEESVV
jgi:hypothetical protein